MDYARDQGMGDDQAEFLWEIIQKVDGRFLKLLAEKSQPPSGSRR